jgi:regulator of replication initiation timing
MPYVTEDTLGELDCKIDALQDDIDGLVKQVEALEVTVDQCEVERSDLRAENAKLRAALEECLEWFQDRYDITDETDDDGTPHGNSEMHMGQQVEEWLGRGGF